MNQQRLGNVISFIDYKKYIIWIVLINLFFSIQDSFAEQYKPITNNEAQFSGECSMANLLEPLVKKLPIACHPHDVVIPSLRIKNVCVYAVKLRCEIIQSREGQFISFTGMHEDVSWVLHALLHSENTPNGLLSLIKLSSN